MYRAFAAEAETMGRRPAAGIGVGDRVGVRMPSGEIGLYIGILGALAAGAAYVPVDADDPDERARLVFSQAGIAAELGPGRSLDLYGDARTPLMPQRPCLADDAWIIFTSGSTGKPKGVAVRLFLAEEPMGLESRPAAVASLPAVMSLAAGLRGYRRGLLWVGRCEVGTFLHLPLRYAALAMHSCQPIRAAAGVWQPTSECSRRKGLSR